MTNRQLDNRVKKLRAIEARQKELEAQAEVIRDVAARSADLSGYVLKRMKEVRA